MSSLLCGRSQSYNFTASDFEFVFSWSFQTSANLVPSLLPSKYASKLEFGTSNFKYVWMSFLFLVFIFYCPSLREKKTHLAVPSNQKLEISLLEYLNLSSQSFTDLMCLISVFL